MTVPLATIAQVDLAAEFRHLAGILLSLLQPVLLLLLCLGFILALAHLLIMLGTRWGDRRVTSKALFFSVAVHISLAFGIIAMVPEYREQFMFQLTTEEEPPAIEIEPVPFEAETTRDLELPGNTPVWEEMTDLPSPEIDRIARTTDPQESDPLTPKPEFEAEERLTPDVSYLPLETETLPQQRPEAQTGPMEIAAIPLPVDDPVAEARPEIEFPSTAQERSAVVSNSPQPTENAQRPARGTVERITPDFDPRATLQGLDAPNSPDATLSNENPDLELSHREGPAPAVMSAEASGSGTGEASTASNTAPGPPQVSRERTRSPQNITDAGVQRVRPGAMPQLPDVTSGEPIASITGQSGSSFLAPSELPGLRDSDNAAGRLDAVPVPGTYQLRTPEQQDMAVEQFGGTEESEQAVELALKWLASVQTDEGYWDGEAHGAGRVEEDDAGREDAGREADTGLTGLALLAFLAKQHTHEQGEYSAHVERGLRWLVSQQRSDGYLGGEASKVSAMYCHAIATFALAEAYAMRTDPTSGEWMREPIQLAVDYILSCQLADGGWRYERGQPDGDMSMFGWQLMALKSAEQAGFSIPPDVRTRMVGFLRDRSLGESGGHASYRANEAVTPSMTAEALFSKQILGMTRENPASLEAVAYLEAHSPRRTELNLYYWYYGTLAMFQYGGESWERWNESVREILILDQRTSGPLAGSWDPRDPWGPYGGRIYSTAMSAMCLEVYYRYLPLYQSGGRYGEE